MLDIVFTHNISFTYGHEHLWDFGLINMNGRMYDPLTASFLSPDNNVQDPTSQQGFNRYAYCAYNPLKYVDPTGELYFGWNGNSSYYEERAFKELMQFRYNQYLEIMDVTWKRINGYINSIYSQGNSSQGVLSSNGGSGNHGSPGGGSQQTPIGNNQGDGDPTNNTTNSNDTQFDTYDFDLHRNKDGEWLTKRNTATLFAGFLFYGVIDNYHIIPSPSMFFGGKFNIYFDGKVHIKKP